MNIIGSKRTIYFIEAKYILIKYFEDFQIGFIFSINNDCFVASNVTTIIVTPRTRIYLICEFIFNSIVAMY